MKLLFVIDHFYKGGAETSLLNLMKRINADRAHEVDFIIMDQRPVKGAVSLIDQVPDEINVLDIWKMQKRHSFLNRIRAKLLLTSEEKQSNPPAALLYIRQKEYDWAFHVGEWWSPDFVAINVRARHKVLWIHTDLSKAEYFDADNFFKYDKMISKYFFVSNHSLYSSLEAFPFIKNKSICIYNITDANQIRQKAKEELEEDYFQRGLPVLVTCANIRKEKNHKRQLEAMELLKKRGIDFIWLNLGNTSETARCKQLLAEAEALGLKDRFILTGAKENPYKYMSRANAVAVLSDYESWSMVITEAKLLGVPVISTKTSGAMEQLVDGETGLLTEFNATDIAGKIEGFLRSPELEHRLRENIEHFDNTSEIISSFWNALIEDSSLENNNLKELLYVIDDINYQSGAHIATKLQIHELLKKGHHISIFSSSIPTAEIRRELNGVTFLGWKDFPQDKLYHRRLLDCLGDSRLSKAEKRYKLRLTWEGKFRKNANVFDDMVFPYLAEVFAGYGTICIMSEGSIFRKIVANTDCKNKVQWIHIDYCQWRNQSVWTRKITKNDGTLYRSFDKIVVLTPSIRQSFLKLYPHLASKVVVNANLIPVQEIREKAKRRTGNYLHFVTVGRVDKQKAFDRLYEVLTRLYTDGYRFYWTIIGDGEEFHYIRSLFTQSVLQKYVILTGGLPNPFPYLKDADVFALLSEYEGLPNTIFESLILGIPVIATNVGGVATQICHGETGWLVDNHEDAIYAGLKYILDHPEQVAYAKQQLEGYQYDNTAILHTAENVLFGE